MKHWQQWFLPFIFIFSLFYLVSPRGILAAESGSIGLFPAHPNPKIPYSQAWLIYNLVAGETKRDAFVVVNKSSKPVAVKLYPVDATTTKDGSFALKGEEAKREGVGAWVKLSTNKVVVPPKGKKVVEFTISVPRNAEVGDHMGGVIAERLGQLKSTGPLKIKTRIGLRIYETVPGELKKELSVKSFKVAYLGGNKTSPDQLRLTFELENKGDVHLDPLAAVELINNLNGQVVAKRELSLGTIFPDSSTKVPVSWTKIPLFGSFVVRAKVRYAKDDNHFITKEARIFYISKKAKFIAGSVAVVALMGVAFLVVGKEVKR